MNKQYYLPPLFCFIVMIFYPSDLHGQETITLGMNSNEPTVVLSPQSNSNKIIAAANVNQLYYLKKGAESFKNTQAKSTLGVYGDPVLHYSDHDLFYAHLSKTQNKKYGEWFDRIFVQKIHSITPWRE